MENNTSPITLRRPRPTLTPFFSISETIEEEQMDDVFRTPNSAPSYEESFVEALLGQALEQKEDPANYLTNLMPSRQLYRSGLGLNATYQTCQLTRKRLNSTRRKTVMSDPNLEGVEFVESDGKLKTPFPMDNVTLLKEMVSEKEVDRNFNENRQRFKCGSVPMAIRRDMRDELTKSRENIANRYRRANWKMKMSKNYNFLRESAGSAFSNIHFWESSIHNIEGHYGTAVAAVFFFIQYLMTINLMIMFLVVVFIVIPNSVIMARLPLNESIIVNHPPVLLYCNTNATDTTSPPSTEFRNFQDLLQGTGWMEWTAMFYGYYFYNYTNGSHWREPFSNTYDAAEDLAYNLPLAYIVITVLYFIICLTTILKSTAKDSREILFTATTKINECCNLIFCGWDFCIVEEKEAKIRKDIIYNETINIIEEEKIWHERLRRTKRQQAKIYVYRILINILVFLILALCGYIIYIVVIESQDALSKAESDGLDMLIIEFLPPFVITVLNLVVPCIFEKLVTYESYPPVTVTNMTLGRTVVLKMAGILVLLASLYKGIVNNTQCFYHCWETYVGQQIYKLTIMDFVSIIFITFFIQFPRKIIVHRWKWSFVQWIGQQPFDIPSQVLDIVYSQTLCWMGVYFSPLLCVVNVIKYFILFYVKKFSLFVNCAPAKLTYRSSKSNKLFMMILLLSYIIASLPVFFSVVELPPSTDCGPFIGFDRMWDIIPVTMESWPTALRGFAKYFTTAGFAIPAVIILSLIIYFYTTVASAHKREKELMQDQLLVEGHDKQYLLKKLHQTMAELSKEEVSRNSIRSNDT
ncbi:hypothetical protein CHUAL_007857 [Chamberlinius hualienensis]